MEVSEEWSVTISSDLGDIILFNFSLPEKSAVFSMISTTFTLNI